MNLNPRAELLLKTLVERYIVEGEPVGSRTLARYTGLDLSPATVRNVMMDLEEMGLVSSPHTSAGRIPTQRGYRLFVDTLLKVRPLDKEALRKLEGEPSIEQNPDALIENASHLLSEVSKFAGLVMVPRRDEHLTFRHIDFLSLSNKRLLVILVTQDGHVDNRVITTDRDYTSSEVTEAANYFNASYSGMLLADVKRALLNEMQQVTADMQRIMNLAVEMARKAFAAEKNEADELLVSGESNLMDVPDLGDVKKLRRLFDAFEAKRDLLQLLDQSMRVHGVKIFIGAESGHAALEDCSVVTASYTVDKQVVGTLGVIGPTRMPYEHIIPIVDITARLLGAALSGQGDAPRLESSGPWPHSAGLVELLFNNGVGMAQEQQPAAPERVEAHATQNAPDNGTETAQLRAQLEAVQVEAAQNRDRLLRVAADMENARRRAEIDLANAHKYSIERFANELLPVRDSLEFARTVDIRQENQTALQKMHEGLDLTLKLMDDAFRKFNLVAIDPKGEKFDPSKHHAISMVESAEVPPNHVVTVMQKGYLLQDRVLRPAMVVVAKAPTTSRP